MLRFKKYSKLFLLYLMALALTALPSAPIVTAAMNTDPTDDDACAKVLVVFARGSGQNSNDIYTDSNDSSYDSLYAEANVHQGENQTAAFFKEFHKRVPTGVKYVSLYNETSSTGQKYNKYGYAAVSAFDAITLPYDAYFKPAEHRKDVANRYYESVKDGAEELAWYLEDQMTSCPLQRVVLGGYSQGAEVVADGINIMRQGFRSRIAYVAFYGDPKFNAEQPGSITLGPWVRGNAHFLVTTHGVLDARDSYVPGGIANIGSWCASGDKICDAGHMNYKNISRAFVEHFILKENPFQSSVHGNAYQDTWIPQSMPEVVRAAQNATPNINTTTSVFVNKGDKLWNLDLAIVIDRDSSMQQVLGTLKGNVTSLTTQLLGSYWNSRVGIVTYNAPPSGWEYPGYEYSRVTTPFTNDENNLRGSISNIMAQSTFYGTLSEGSYYQLHEQSAQYDGIMTAINGLQWEHGAQKKIIVITNNKAQNLDPSPNHWTTEQVRKAAFDLDPAGLNLANVSCDETWNCDYGIDEAFQQLATDSGGQVGDVNLSFGTIDDLQALLENIHTQPVAKVNGDQTGYTGVPVNMNASESYDPNGAVTEYDWDCTSRGQWDIASSAPVGSCSYDQPGDYVVTLRAWSSDDQQGTLAVWPVHVVAGQPPSVPVPETPQAKLSYRADGQLLSWDAAYDPDTYLKVSDADDNLMGYAPADAPGILLHLPGGMTELHIRASSGDSDTWSEPAVLTLNGAELEQAFEPGENDDIDAFTILGQATPGSTDSQAAAAATTSDTTPANPSPTANSPVAELLRQAATVQLANSFTPELFTGSGSAANTTGDAAHILGSVTQQNKPASSAEKHRSPLGFYTIFLTLSVILAAGWSVWRYAGRKNG